MPSPNRAARDENKRQTTPAPASGDAYSALTVVKQAPPEVMAAIAANDTDPLGTTTRPPMRSPTASEVRLVVEGGPSLMLPPPLPRFWSEEEEEEEEHCSADEADTSAVASGDDIDDPIVPASELSSTPPRPHEEVLAAHADEVVPDYSPLAPTTSSTAPRLARRPVAPPMTAAPPVILSSQIGVSPRITYRPTVPPPFVSGVSPLRDDDWTYFAAAIGGLAAAIALAGWLLL